MKRKILISSFCVLSSLLISYFLELKVSENFINTLYTVAGIMFSIGMGVICTFNPDRVKNEKYLKRIKRNLELVRSSFFFYFLLLTASYSTYQLIPKPASIKISKYIIFDLSIFLPILAGACILYFVVNFNSIHRLNLQIAERTLES